MKLPRTQAPMAILQLRPTEIIDEAVSISCQCCTSRHTRDILRLTNCPIGHCPSIGHPVCDIRRPTPCSLGRRNGIEVSVGRVLRLREGAGLLLDLEVEVWETLPDLADGHTMIDCRSGWRAMLLVIVHVLVIFSHGGRAKLCNKRYEMERELYTRSRVVAVDRLDLIIA